MRTIHEPQHVRCGSSGDGKFTESQSQSDCQSANRRAHLHARLHLLLLNRVCSVFGVRAGGSRVHVFSKARRRISCISTAPVYVSQNLNRGVSPRCDSATLVERISHRRAPRATCTDRFFDMCNRTFTRKSSHARARRLGGRQLPRIRTKQVERSRVLVLHACVLAHYTAPCTVAP